VKLFQKQVGGMDCGVFAIAAVTALVFNIDVRFKQEDV